MAGVGSPDLIEQLLAEARDPEDKIWLLGQLRQHALHYEDDWRGWLGAVAPKHTIHPFGEHHERFWRHVWTIEAGMRAAAFLAVWSRGGAKSTSAELATLALGMRSKRRYALYLSKIQSKANDHVGTIQSIAEGDEFGAIYPGSERMMGKYGQSKGWKRNRLRFGNGFTVDALGLDTAVRGAKIDEERPDLLILDDIDDHSDTEDAVQKKLDTISKAILPAGSDDMCVLIINNLVHPNGVIARLLDGRADMLNDRIVSGPVPAIRDLAYDKIPDPTEENPARVRYKITAGTPTWPGQSVPVAESQMNAWGLQAFLTEAQHDMTARKGDMFKEGDWQYLDEIPECRLWVRGWDFGATEGGGDYTVGLLMGAFSGGWVITEVVRFQGNESTIETKMLDCHNRDHRRVIYRLPQDPGAGGKNYANIMAKKLAGRRVKIEAPTGSKADRASALAAQQQLHNVFLLRAPWNGPLVAEYSPFPHQAPNDDQVDAGADAFNELVLVGTGRGGLRG